MGSACGAQVGRGPLWKHREGACREPASPAGSGRVRVASVWPDSPSGPDQQRAAPRGLQWASGTDKEVCGVQGGPAQGSQGASFHRRAEPQPRAPGRVGCGPAGVGPRGAFLFPTSPHPMGARGAGLARAGPRTEATGSSAPLCVPVSLKLTSASLRRGPALPSSPSGWAGALRGGGVSPSCSLRPPGSPHWQSLLVSPRHPRGRRRGGQGGDHALSSQRPCPCP